MPKYPFEASFDEILKDSEKYIDAVFSSLESEFLIMPKGAGFIEYPVFERGYEALKTATRGKVFTLKTLNQLVEHTRLKGFKTS
jgi:hypothetical protein